MAGKDPPLQVARHLALCELVQSDHLIALVLYPPDVAGGRSRHRTVTARADHRHVLDHVFRDVDRVLFAHELAEDVALKKGELPGRVPGRVRWVGRAAERAEEATPGPVVGMGEHATRARHANARGGGPPGP